MFYNQLAQKSTNYSCSVYAFLNVIKYDFWLEIPVDTILKIVIYLEKIWALLPWWSYAGILFPAIIKYTEYKTWFKLIIVKWTINNIDNKKAWILWYKKADSKYINLAKDWTITRSDIDTINKNTKFWWHFHMWKRNTVIETLWWFAYRLMRLNLKYAHSKGMYYDAVRAFIPWDERTEKAQKYLVNLVKERWEFIKYEEFITMDFK